MDFPDLELQSVQRSWDLLTVKRKTNDIWPAAVDSVLEAACLFAAMGLRSGLWLNALPASALENLMADDHLRIGVGLRLGAEWRVGHTCRCGSKVDVWGYHGLSCSFSKGRPICHGFLNDGAQRGLSTGGIQSLLEPTVVYRDDEMRPNGMAASPWMNDKPVVRDVTA